MKGEKKMEYCKSCKIHEDNKCLAGYKNPTTGPKTAVNQARNGGEWPCTFAPHRAEFLALYRPGLKIKVPDVYLS
jgi:hypothetical protein